jgi:hypothetical protein
MILSLKVRGKFKVWDNLTVGTLNPVAVCRWTFEVEAPDLYVHHCKREFQLSRGLVRWRVNNSKIASSLPIQRWDSTMIITKDRIDLELIDKPRQVFIRYG